MKIWSRIVDAVSGDPSPSFDVPKGWPPGWTVAIGEYGSVQLAPPDGVPLSRDFTRTQPRTSLARAIELARREAWNCVTADARRAEWHAKARDYARSIGAPLAGEE